MAFLNITILRALSLSYPEPCLLIFNPQSHKVLFPIDFHRTANIFAAFWKGLLLRCTHREQGSHTSASLRFVHGSAPCLFPPTSSAPGSAWLMFLVMFLCLHFSRSHAIAWGLIVFPVPELMKRTQLKTKKKKNQYYFLSWKKARLDQLALIFK